MVVVAVRLHVVVGGWCVMAFLGGEPYRWVVWGRVLPVCLLSWVGSEDVRTGNTWVGWGVAVPWLPVPVVRTAILTGVHVVWVLVGVGVRLGLWVCVPVVDVGFTIGAMVWGGPREGPARVVATRIVVASSVVAVLGGSPPAR